VNIIILLYGFFLLENNKDELKNIRDIKQGIEEIKLTSRDAIECM